MAATIGMADEPFGEPLPLRRHHQRRERQLGAHVVAHRPADDLARREVENSGQVKPTFVGGDVCDVGEPDAVRCRCDELLLQPVRRDRQVMTAVGRARLEPAAGERANPVPPDQALDPATACRPASA